jgi:hypothetical protein
MALRTVAVRTMLALRPLLAGRLVAGRLVAGRLIAIVGLHPLAVAVLTRGFAAMMMLMLTTGTTIGSALSARLVTAMLGTATPRAAML